jgi:hypothetical protein
MLKKLQLTVLVHMDPQSAVGTKHRADRSDRSSSQSPKFSAEIVGDAPVALVL